MGVLRRETKGYLMKLTDISCRSAKPKEKPYKKSDGGGLYLYVKPDGAKYWRLKYYYLGKEKLMALGIYPLISLQEAREKRDTAKRLLDKGQDPNSVKRERKRQTLERHKNTFEAVAREWHENQLAKWSEQHGHNVMRRMDVDIFPYIGKRPIADIDPPELLEVLRKIEKRGALDVTARVKQISGQVFRYGIATGRCERDPSADLKGALKVGKVSHFAALDIKEIPEFLQTLERNQARLFARTQRAIKMLMLTFVRTNELINATWDEFDFDNATWEIPGWRMKMRNPHIVPLSRQVIELLKEQKEETGHLNTDWVWTATCLATGISLFRSLVNKYHSGEDMPEDFSRPQEIGSTLYFTGEGQDGIEGRILALESFLGERVLGHLPHAQLPIIHVARNIFRLQGSNQLKELQNYLKPTIDYYTSMGFPPRQIIFDTASTCFEVNNEDNSDERDLLFDTLNQISRMFNCFVFVVMYPPKSGGRKGVPKGTIESANRADLMLHISPLPRAKNKFQVTVIKAKDLPSYGLNFKFKTEVHNGFAALIPNDDVEDIRFSIFAVDY